MTTDPFELSQYTTSFDRIDAFSPNALIFADFQVEFSRISEQILARQVSIGVGFNVPDIEFAPISNFEATTPAGVVEAIRLFQEAIGEFVTGGIIDRYGRLSNCDVYIGFFHFSNGFPIVGLGQILPDSGQTDWTEPPDINDISSVVTFTQEVGNNLNEIVFALNVLKYIHGRMVLAYDLDDSCGNPPTPTPPTPTPTPTPAPTPTPTPPTSAPASNYIDRDDNKIRYTRIANLGEYFGIEKQTDGTSIDNI